VRSEILHKPSGWSGAAWRRQVRFWVGRRHRRADKNALGGTGDPAVIQPYGQPDETPIGKALRTAIDLELLVERQRELVFELRRNGIPTEGAEAVLRMSHAALVEHRKYLAMMQNRQRRGLLARTGSTREDGDAPNGAIPSSEHASRAAPIDQGLGG